MSAHLAQAIRYTTGHRRWDAWCRNGCGVLRDVDGQRARSREGAEFLADEHYRATCCGCWSVEHVELSPTPCPNCASKETSA